MIEITNILEVAKHLTGLKVVVFDLDDTLYSEKEYVRSGYKMIAKLFPDVSNAEKKMWDFFEGGQPAIDCFLQQEGCWTEDNKKLCLEVYRNQQPDIHLYDGVAEMLQKLKENYHLGLITDGRPEGQRAKIAALKLADLFEHIIVTDELGGIQYRKPNQAAFELMTQKMGVRCDEMCYIGDNIKKDFVAPEKLGMRCIWFKNASGLYNR